MNESLRSDVIDFCADILEMVSGKLSDDVVFSRAEAAARRNGIPFEYFAYLADLCLYQSQGNPVGPAPEPPPGPEPVTSHRPEKPPKRRPKPALSDPPKTALSFSSRSWQMWKSLFPSAAGGERK